MSVVKRPRAWFYWLTAIFNWDNYFTVIIYAIWNFRKRRSEDVSEEEDIVSEKEKRRKKKKRKTDVSEEGTPEADGFDPTLTAQMMHQFFAMEQVRLKFWF